MKLSSCKSASVFQDFRLSTFLHHQTSYGTRGKPWGQCCKQLPQHVKPKSLSESEGVALRCIPPHRSTWPALSTLHDSDWFCLDSTYPETLPNKLGLAAGNPRALGHLLGALVSHRLPFLRAADNPAATARFWHWRYDVFRPVPNFPSRLHFRDNSSIFAPAFRVKGISLWHSCGSRVVSRLESTALPTHRSGPLRRVRV